MIPGLSEKAEPGPAPGHPRTCSHPAARVKPKEKHVPPLLKTPNSPHFTRRKDVGTGTFAALYS